MRKQKTGNFITFLLSFLIVVVLVGLGLFLWYEYDSNKEAFVSKVSDFANQTTGDKQQEQDNKIQIQEVENPLNKIQGIENINVNTSEINSYYYNQLDQNSKIIYAALANNVDKLKTGVSEIDLGENFQDTLSQQGGQEILGSAFQSAWDAFSVDRPDIFYLDAAKMYLHMEEKRSILKTTYHTYIGKGQNANYFGGTFQTQSEVESAIANVENVTGQVVSQVSGNNHDKIKQIHDWLVGYIEYDESLCRPNTHNIYGALIEKQVVCEGYAESFKYLMDKLGIPCVIVIGTATNSQGETESHAWNYVELDGNWYAVDTTWDDPIVIGGGRLPASEKYKYFLKGANTFNKDHFPRGNMTTDGKVFHYPTLSKQDYKK